MPASLRFSPYKGIKPPSPQLERLCAFRLCRLYRTYVRLQAGKGGIQLDFSKPIQRV